MLRLMLRAHHIAIHTAMRTSSQRLAQHSHTLTGYNNSAMLTGDIAYVLNEI